MRVAINEFGRIGRSVLRALATMRSGTGIEVALINDVAPLETCAYRFEFDSTFGPLPGQVAARPGALVVNGWTISFHHVADLSEIPCKPSGIHKRKFDAGRGHQPEEMAKGGACAPPFP